MQCSLVDWEFLSHLLHTGYPLVEALQFLHLPTTKFQEQLEKGLDVKAILIYGKKGRFYEHMQFFMDISSFPDAIDSSLRMLRFEQDFIRKLLKKTAYPMCILVFAYLMLFFFSAYIIPQMLNSFSISEDFQFLSICITVIRNSSTFLGLCIICLCLFALYLKFHASIRVALLLRLHNFRLLKDINSYYFAGYMVELERKGIATRNAMLYLQSIHKESVFQSFIRQIKQELERGEDVLDVMESNALLNEDFKVSFRIGAKTAKVEMMLATFLKQQELYWESVVKKASILVQSVAYGFVGVMVLLVYQIMLIPLTMLENM